MRTNEQHEKLSVFVRTLPLVPLDFRSLIEMQYK